MYALCIGVRDQFFSLSCFDEKPAKAIQKALEVESAWLGAYRLDPSWDQTLNGQDESLVWCLDGSKVLLPRHFERGFFMHLVKESKDSEIKMWKPLPGSLRFVAVDLWDAEHDDRLRVVRPFFKSTASVERSWLRRSNAVAFSERHLTWWHDRMQRDANESFQLRARGSQTYAAWNAKDDRTAN